MILEDFQVICYDIETVFEFIDDCNRNIIKHFQQVVYSVHGTCLTQICFVCKVVRTSYEAPN